MKLKLYLLEYNHQFVGNVSQKAGEVAVARVMPPFHQVRRVPEQDPFLGLSKDLIVELAQHY